MTAKNTAYLCNSSFINCFSAQSGFKYGAFLSVKIFFNNEKKVIHCPIN